MLDSFIPLSACHALILKRVALSPIVSLFPKYRLVSRFSTTRGALCPERTNQGLSVMVQHAAISMSNRLLGRLVHTRTRMAGSLRDQLRKYELVLAKSRI
jgi:hypothetical protein